MSSFSVVNFNQLVDLVVNPSQGTINIALMHNLLHIVIDQLQLSSELIEFHGVGSAAIENLIVNSRRNCGLEINEFKVLTEVDDASGNIVKRREQIQKLESNEKVKVFTIRVDSNVEECPLGSQLNLIQFNSNEGIQKLEDDNVHDVNLHDVIHITDISGNREDENSFKENYNFKNISERIDALEVEIQQLKEVLKRNQNDVRRSETVLNLNASELHQRTDNFSEQIENLKCNGKDLEENSVNNFNDKLTQEFADLSMVMESEINNLKTSFKGIEIEMIQFKDSVCERLESYKNDFVCCMTEIQTMLDAKLDKYDVPDLKKYLQEMIHNLEGKIENVDSPKPLAAGAVKKIFNDLNCISCGKSVVQANNPKSHTINADDK